MTDSAVAHKLFDDLKDRLPECQGGYVRIMKRGTRKGDGAPVSIVQLLKPEEGKKKGKSRQSGGKDKSSAKKAERKKEDAGPAPAEAESGDVENQTAS